MSKYFRFDDNELDILHPDVVDLLQIRFFNMCVYFLFKRLLSYYHHFRFYHVAIYFCFVQ